MEDYIRARPDVFSTGADGFHAQQPRVHAAAGTTLAICSSARRCRSILPQQLDRHAGSYRRSAAPPNMRRRARSAARSPTWLKAGRQAVKGSPVLAARPVARSSWCKWSRRFVNTVQPTFVEHLDAWTLAEQAKMPLPPIMIYGESTTSWTEGSIANLLLCRGR